MRTYNNSELRELASLLDSTYEERGVSAQILAFLRTLSFAGTCCHSLKWGELERRALSTICLQVWSNDAGEEIFLLPKNVWVHAHDRGYEVTQETSPCVESYLDSWSCNVTDDLNEIKVSFGVNPGLDALYTAGVDAHPAPEKGRYRVWIDYNYYCGACNAPSDSWLRDGAEQIKEFESLMDAVHEADCHEGEQYVTEGGRKSLVLSQNQAGSTNFIVCSI